jgi:hypothetical protein
MSFEMDTAKSIYLFAWYIGSLTLAWLVVHAYLRFAWTRPVTKGRMHGQSSAQSLAHAGAAVGILVLAMVSANVVLEVQYHLFDHGWTTSWHFPPFSISSDVSIAAAAVLAILYTPLFAYVLSLSGYVSDSRRIDFGRATGTALVTMVALVVWSAFVLEHVPREHG